MSQSQIIQLYNIKKNIEGSKFTKKQKFKLKKMERCHM